ncbi:unnamed protein product [Meganyctiphanes norvegica]|uniref:Uncharacterized protein n=1 Tax=Meganyctiphanes norvegica TaxID=48144 RepID=A0AAV2Q8H7_MEGNR
MGGQPSLPQHMPQHSPHTHSAQSPHTHQYPGHSSVASAVAAAHHQSNQQLPPQIVMLPHNMAGGGPHMMPHPQGPPPPPHSANQHIPSSMAAAFTPTSSASMQHMNPQPHAAIQYLQGGHGNQGHPAMQPVMPHHSQ